MKKIPLTQGKFALVDNADFEFLNQWKWYCEKDYAARQIKKNGKNIVLYMHRVILSAKKGQFCDHINGARNDNRRENLRLCLHAENMRNSKIQINNKSGFKGVSYNKKAKKWKAYIGRAIYLGFFSCKEDAARAYNEAALKRFGEFARLNPVAPEPKTLEQ